MLSFWRVCLLLSLLSIPVVAIAQDSWQEALDGFDVETEQTETSDVLSGFEDESTAQLPPPSLSDSDGPLQFSGWLKLDSSWNFAHNAPEAGETDWRGFSRLRPELLLKSDLQLPQNWQLLVSGKGSYDFAYRLNGRSGYSSQVLDEYESELELRDTYLAGSLTDWLDLKLGRQIVVWGRSDNLRVTDILNPLDLREPGLTDIEDLRLPVGMLKMDAYQGPWNLSALLIPEIRFDKTPVFGQDFFPAATPLPAETIPSDCMHNAEYALALNGVFPRWDISLYWTDFFSDTPHFHSDGSGELRRKHSRQQMFGAAGNFTFGNNLLFSEVARFSGLQFLAAPGRDFSRLDLLVGWEYSGWTDTTLSIEAVQRQLLDYLPQLSSSPENVEEYQFQWALRLQRELFQQRLTLTWLALLAEEDGSGGALQRFQADYELAEALELIAGVVFYYSGDSNGFQNVGDNDRIFLELRYSF